MVTVSLLLRLFTRPFPSVVNREGPVAKESGFPRLLAGPRPRRSHSRTRSRNPAAQEKESGKWIARSDPPADRSKKGPEAMVRTTC